MKRRVGLERALRRVRRLASLLLEPAAGRKFGAHRTIRQLTAVEIDLNLAIVEVAADQLLGQRILHNAESPGEADGRHTSDPCT